MLTQNNKPVFIPRIIKVKGVDAWYVQSKSKPNEFHRVTLNWCDCKAFEFRRQCRHVEDVFEKLEKESQQQL